MAGTFIALAPRQQWRRHPPRWYQPRVETYPRPALYRPSLPAGIGADLRLHPEAVPSFAFDAGFVWPWTRREGTRTILPMGGEQRTARTRRRQDRVKALKRIAARCLAAVVGLYLVLMGVLYFVQRMLLYGPDPVSRTAASLGLDGVRDVVIETRDGERLRALYLPAAAGRATVLYLHGSRGYLPERAGRMKLLAAEGHGVLFLSYRGYSGSTGEPTEGGLMEDARAAYGWLAREVPGGRIILYGESLGTAIASKLATERPAVAIVLDAAFTTAADVMAPHLPFVPVSTLMKDQYRSIEWIKDIRAPVLFLHGDADRNVPIAQGERLFQEAPEPKRFIRIEGGGHGDNLERESREVLHFIRSIE